jgi:hypothetical protein
MAKKAKTGITLHEPTRKGTCIGRGIFKTSSMNKSRKRSFKKYRGQGK